ncbi:MAG: dolichol-phosphate mannosyltransferase [Solirubrobacteraceae bacterium]|nr:dolichol-phosphate mannosyltransferase [Solirubrobacteraceae bacterium]
MRATICLPTYNERDNLEPMLRALGAVLREGDRVLVVDDGSPDGTGALADSLAGELGFVDVLHRERKEGLGPAYIAGFREVLAGDAELVLEMDCDFSHDPADVPRLIAAAETGADLVLGSRYVPGGSIPNWGLVRRAVSLGGNLYAQLFLTSGIRDLTGGFKCFRREVLEAIDLTRVRSQGYAFQVELTYRALERGFEVTEVPIVFRDRRLGRSKMSPSIAIEACWMLPRLRFAHRDPGPGAGGPGPG